MRSNKENFALMKRNVMFINGVGLNKTFQMIVNPRIDR